MGNMMTFPASVEEFMEQYKITDTEHVYSNGTEYVPVYRMKQWFEHCRHQQFPAADVATVRHGRWISLTDCSNAGVYCSVCHKKVYKEDYAICNRKNKLRSDYCPNCGAKMDGELNE